MGSSLGKAREYRLLLITGAIGSRTLVVLLLFAISVLAMAFAAVVFLAVGLVLFSARIRLAVIVIGVRDIQGKRQGAQGSEEESFHRIYGKWTLRCPRFEGVSGLSDFARFAG